MSALKRIRKALEAQKQSEHDDDKQECHELAWAATCYMAPGPIFAHSEYSDDRRHTYIDPWPFDTNQDDRVRDGAIDIDARIVEIVKACAWGAREIERLERMKGQGDG